MRQLIKFIFLFSLPFAFALPSFAQVQISHNQLVIDNVTQPQLFGGELQYFRLRGGYGRNIPRAEVIALWNKALDRMVEAKMNTVSFYIPWDFHEYAEGQFDFTGNVDEDGDGNPDYPSRDLQTFFKLIEQHGIHRILVRPGPYINAEWGFLGFGAVPEWFHNKYPDSHMRTSYGWRTRLYDYHNPDFLRHSRLWFEALYKQVLKNQIGPGKPVVFLQLDNETNFQWQSIYNHDYGPRAIHRYQQFLQEKYLDLAVLNRTHQRNWMHWSLIQAPVRPGENLAEDRDWYQFADQSIYSYLGEIRKIWQNIGVAEPQVLFTLAESYNSVPNGLLPNFAFRNSPASTGMMTVNLYPKTDEAGHPVLNSPFKADLDVKSADSASDHYLGSKQEWVMGPEIQAGWWRGTSVSAEARLQTYLTILGHGLKAFYVYYFNEGQNWNVEWAAQQIKPLFDRLVEEQKLAQVPLSQLSNEFWGELQARSDREILVGFDVRHLMQNDPLENKDLYFDAPLDGHAEARDSFRQLKSIGERVISPYQDFLSRSLEVQDDVALVKDDWSHQPSGRAAIPSVIAASDWSGSLLGLLMNADINPSLLHADLSSESEFYSKLLVHLDTGVNSQRSLEIFKAALLRGQSVINFISSQVSKSVGLEITTTPLLSTEKSPVIFYLNSQGELSNGKGPGDVAHSIEIETPLESYDLSSSVNKNCQGLLFWQNQTVGYSCPVARGKFTQISAALFENYNSNHYAELPASAERRIFMKTLLISNQVQSLLEISNKSAELLVANTFAKTAAPRSEHLTVAFARKDPLKKTLWITVKTGSTRAQKLWLKISPELLEKALSTHLKFSVKNLMAQTQASIESSELIRTGFAIELEASGSAVFVVEGLL